MSPIVKIGWNKTTIDGDPDATAALAARFATQHAMLLDDALDDDFFARLGELVRQAQFIEKRVAQFGIRANEYPGFAGHFLCQALMRPAMLSFVEKVTACGPIAAVSGRVSRYTAGTGQHLGWHNDGLKRRRLAMTINLGTEPYAGGEFELRERGSSELLLRFIHSKPGTALIFRVAKNLEHRVLPITAGGPRTVFAGWFLSAVAPSDDAPSDDDQADH